MPLQTWPGQECVSACSGFIQLLGCPEAFPASLQHTPGPKAPKRFPMRHLTGASPPVGTHLKSPAGCSMLREVRSQHLWQTRSRSPSSFLAPGGQIIKWGGGLPGWGHSGERPREWEPKGPKANPCGSLGVRSGVSLEEGADTGTHIPDKSKARAPEQMGASPHPGAAFAPSYQQDQEFQLCCREPE